MTTFSVKTRNSDLLPGRTIPMGQFLNSPGAGFLLIFQNDSNLVLYPIDDGPFNWGNPAGTTQYSFSASQNYLTGQSTWAANTNGSGANLCIMQDDGNLVIYKDNNIPVWSSGTYGHPGAYLRVQDDGNVVIYSGGNPLWASNTNARR